MDQPSEYDLRLTALLKQVEDLQSQGDAAGDRVRVLLESANPLDQVAGLTWAAESGRIDPEFDLARFDPEVILAATDLAASLAGAAAADRLLMNWIEQAGGLKSAGEAAHRLLMEARLPYGGGSTALDLMRSVNDPQAILIGLREFAVDPELNPAIRMEALILLRERMDFGAYQEFVRRCAGNARQEGGAWAWRAARLLEQVDGPPDIMAQPREINRTVIDRALARADPGAMEDLEIFLRRETQADHVRMDAETAAYFRAALAAVAESGLTGPDRAALTSLRRQVDSWE